MICFNSTTSLEVIIIIIVIVYKEH
jgi:hypothetical protein